LCINRLGVIDLPIYEYECSHCSSRFELKRSFSDNSPVTCPQCGCDAQQIFSPVPIIFKGSGFYSTDYRGNHGHSASTNVTNETQTGDEIKTKAKEEIKTDSTEKTIKK
jgi:putative FmdB family regulatory protein